MLKCKEDGFVFIEGRGHFYKDDLICAVCGTKHTKSRHLYVLNTDDFVCTMKCYYKYARDLVTVQKVF